MQRTLRRVGSVLGAALVAGLMTAPASAAPGPELLEPPERLAAALECSAGLSNASTTPVLLVHGTGSNRKETWFWGYRTVLPQRGIPTCSVELPDRAFVDIQTSVEYVVHAVRRMAATSGRRISVLGHSQGGIHPVWALRFWPDLAGLIDDAIAIATPYQGTDGRHLLPCESDGCPPSVWQQGSGSNFVAALNREPVPGGPSYTSIATEFDQVSFPQPEASRLEGAREILVQQICPGRPVEHFGLAGDAVAFALAIDALNHQGPAEPARISDSVCSQAVFAGANAAQMAAVLPIGVSSPLVMGAAYEGNVTVEPPLRCYADRGCPRADARCSARTAHQVGTDGRDRLIGTPGTDGFSLFGGSDLARGLGGRDRLCGGAANDRLKGGRGRDRLRGGAGRDILRGGPGRDVLAAGRGNDRCVGGGGRDRLRSC